VTKKKPVKKAAAPASAPLPVSWAGNTPTPEQWREILEKHAAWRRGEPSGCRANLRGAYLSVADLSGANLSGANLSVADLSGANLSGANLSGADLRGADLRKAYLSGANLSVADLSGANLSGANLRGATGADLAIARTRILPEGTLIGWKKCRGNVIVKLQIPAEAKRSHAFGRKCRAEFADVLEVIGATVGVSLHDGVTEYRPGRRVTCDKWNEDWTVECGGGVHFYLSRIEAEAHQ